MDNGWAGGVLEVRQTASGIEATLAMFGSGLPVIWCIQSPMYLLR